MWYTTEPGRSVISDEGKLASQLTYNKLRKVFSLPSFESVTVGLSGNLSSLMQWTEDTHIRVLPFTFEKDKRVMLDLVPKDEKMVVGTVSYGASKTINVTFNRTSDAIDILDMFYPHWLVFYRGSGSAYTMRSIREIVENLETRN